MLEQVRQPYNIIPIYAQSGRVRLLITYLSATNRDFLTDKQKRGKYSPTL
jgi:hypothetical protein